MSSFQVGLLQNGNASVVLEIFGFQNALPERIPGHLRTPVFIAGSFVVESAGASADIAVDVGFRIAELPYGQTAIARIVERDGSGGCEEFRLIFRRPAGAEGIMESVDPGTARFTDHVRFVRRQGVDQTLEARPDVLNS
ncbi:hypothetical protein SDC9_192435 [bioreactor metagenome]|uniref:Uncharacterized protein n=1 Tax=bioreactor metagenome TaxID=1076179 RepID=A0A645I0T9_9ZZZZ